MSILLFAAEAVGWEANFKPFYCLTNGGSIAGVLLSNQR